MWCFIVEVAATARVEDNEKDKGEENHEEEQPLPKTNGKRIKIVASTKKK